MKNCFTLIISLSFSFAFAQELKPDKYGYVADAAFHQLISERKYQLVSAFDTIHTDTGNYPVAVVVRENKIYQIDLQGNETAYYDENAAIIRERERRLKKPFASASENYRKIATGFDRNFLKVENEGQYGLTRKKDGKTILEPKYQSLWCYNGNAVSIKENGLYGMADTLGNVLVHPKYDRMELCMTDTLSVRFFIGYKDNLATLVDRNGTELFPPKYTRISPFAIDGILTSSVTNDKQETVIGMIDSNGKILMEPSEFNFLYRIPNTNLFRSESNGENTFGLVNTDGKVMQERRFKYVDIFGGSPLILVEENGKRGFTDKAGNMVISPQYDKANPDDESGLIIVGKATGHNALGDILAYGVVDSSNKAIIPIEYDRLQKTGTVFLAHKGALFYLIDHKGKVLHQYPYWEMTYANDRFIAMDPKKRYGVVDGFDKITIPFVFTNMTSAGKGYFATNAGIINMENEMVIPKGWREITWTNILPLRKSGIFVAGYEGTKTLYLDRYGNAYDAKQLTSRN